MINVKAGEWKLRDLRKVAPFYIGYRANEHLDLEEVICFYLKNSYVSPGCHESESEAFYCKVKELIEIEENNCPNINMLERYHYKIRNFLSSESRTFIINLFSEYEEVKQRIEELADCTENSSVENYNALPDSIKVGSIPDFSLPVYVLEAKSLLSTGELELSERIVTSVESKIINHLNENSLYLDVELSESDLFFSIGPENNNEHYFSKRKSNNAEFIVFQTKESAYKYALDLGLSVPIKEVGYVE